MRANLGIILLLLLLNGCTRPLRNFDSMRPSCLEMQERNLVSMNLRRMQFNHLKTIQSVKFWDIKHRELWERTSLGHLGGIGFAIGCLG